ncbi:O-antigen ligase family protein [Alteromonas mediterranea]|uniref:O-antigen ligase family protein n=1 Tax=Alteromonas mediterranea TaxID=314275 RepID=UPI0032B2A693|tara:strand:- start:15295 stop:16563 length:1269 start_codon:yes stop_codon:yes gene_type:complete
MPITALGFLAVFSVGCLVALKRPFVGLLLYFFVFYMHPPGKYWGSFLPEMRWTLIVAVVTLLSTLMHAKNKGAWLKFKESKILLLFLAYTCIQIPIVTFTEVQIDYVILLFKLIIVFFLIITLVDSEKKLIAVIAANCIGAAYIGLTALQTHTRGRFEAAGLPGIEDGNLLAIHLIPVIIISSAIIVTNLKKRFLIFFPLALVANLLFMSGSRGGLVGIFIAGVCFVFFAPKLKRTQILKWASVAAVAGLMLAGPLIIERVNKVVKASDTEQIDKSAYSRFVIIESQWKMFKDYPLLGFGHRGTLLLSPFYVPEDYMTDTDVGGRRASHNITMSFLVDHGIIGAFLYFWLVFTAFMRIREIKRSGDERINVKLILLGSCSGLLGLMAASQFSNSKVLEISIWLFALIVSAYRFLVKKEEVNK